MVKLSKKYLIFLFIIFCLIISLYLQLQTKEQLQTKLMQKNDFTALRQKPSPPLPKVNNDISPNRKQSINFLTNIFNHMLTYTSGNDYTNQRNALMQDILDKNFFNEFYTSDRDVSGHSITDNLKVKSKLANATIYFLPEKNPNQYLVITNQYYYKDPKTLTSGARLTKTTRAFLLVTNNDKIQSIKPINGLALNNN